MVPYIWFHQVIKPSVVGGFENAAIIAQWAQQHQKMAVISAAFESSLGLSAYIQFSCYLNQKNSEICTMMNYPLASSIAHGLGTYRWLKEDVTTRPLKINRNPRSGFVEASVADADRVSKQFQINGNTSRRNFTGEQVCVYQMPLDSKGLSCSIKIQEIGQRYDVSNYFTDLSTCSFSIPFYIFISLAAICIPQVSCGHQFLHSVAFHSVIFKFRV